MAEGITARAKDYSQWYIDICLKAGLADYSDVRGCMVIKPHGYGIWEKMQSILDAKFKETGHKNAYFPMFIPKSLLCREAEHVDGFAKECAVVTHYRLKNDPDGKGVVVDPEAKLEEELIVRPTSETIIWSTYRKWIQSYRDLPLLINQWANVCRWEMRTRLFLRTTEFLWQEGHTAHATDAEAEVEARQMIEVYRSFAEDYLAIPVVVGRKTEREKFAGAKHTYTIEAMMQDGKALQAGTSHHLGQNFAKAFDVQFQTKGGALEYVHATSWGVSTRLLGAIIMAHSDDQGLVLPPRISPLQVVIVPIFKKQEDFVKILEKLNDLQSSWKGLFSFHIDTREEYTPGWKFSDWELKGIPLRLEMGARDLEQGVIIAVRRDKNRGEEGQKTTIPLNEISREIPLLLEQIQQNLLRKALEFRKLHTYEVRSYEELKSYVQDKSGFYLAWFAGSDKDEEFIKAELGVTVRCVPLESEGVGEGVCFYTGKTTGRKVILAQSY